MMRRTGVKLALIRANIQKNASMIRRVVIFTICIALLLVTSRSYFLKSSQQFQSCADMRNIREAVSDLPTGIRKFAGAYSNYLQMPDVKLIVECGTRSPLTTVLLFEALERGRDTKVFTVDRTVDVATKTLYEAERHCSGITAARAEAVEESTADFSFLTDRIRNIHQREELQVDMLVLHSNHDMILRVARLEKKLRKYLIVHELHHGLSVSKKTSQSKALRDFLLSTGNWMLELFLVEAHEHHYVLRRKLASGTCSSVPLNNTNVQNINEDLIEDVFKNSKLIETTARSKCLKSIEAIERNVNAPSSSLEAISQECQFGAMDDDWRTEYMKYPQLGSVPRHGRTILQNAPLLAIHAMAARYSSRRRLMLWGCDAAVFEILRDVVQHVTLELIVFSGGKKCDRKIPKEFVRDHPFVTNLVVVSSEVLSKSSSILLTRMAILSENRIVIYNAALREIPVQLKQIIHRGFRVLSCSTEGTGMIALEVAFNPLTPNDTLVKRDKVAVFYQKSHKPVFHHVGSMPQSGHVSCSAKSFLRCPEPQCLVLNQTCSKNFYYRLPKKLDLEGQCTRRNFRGDPLPFPPSSVSSSLQNAQYYGSWLFRRWFSFQSTCMEERDNGEMYGRHEPSTQLYGINNFCVRPMGKITGFRPVVETYRGEDEAYYRGSKRSLASFQEWIQDVESMPSAPSCFYDTPVILFPITTGSDDPQRSFHRAGSLLQLVKAAFPDNARNVTVIYVVMKEGMNIAKSSAFSRQKASPVSFYYQIVSRSHMTVVGYDEADEGIWSSLGENFAREHLSVPVCFKKGYAWYNVHMDKPHLGASALPGRQAQFSLYGPRSLYDVQTMKNTIYQFLKCFNRERRKKPNSNNPHVLVPFSKSQRLCNFGAVIDELTEAVQNGGGVLAVIEESGLAAEEYVSRYSSADIVISLNGPNTFWQILSPVGSVLIELVVEDSFAPGANRNRLSGTGGDAYAAAVNHFVYKVPRKMQRKPLGKGSRNSITELDLPPTLFSELFRVAQCLISTQRSCALDESIVEKAMDRHLMDEEGHILESMALRFSTPVLPFKSVVRNKAMFSKFLREFRSQEGTLNLLDIAPRICGVPDSLIGVSLLLNHYVSSIALTSFTVLGTECREANETDVILLLEQMYPDVSPLELLHSPPHSSSNCSGPLDAFSRSHCSAVRGTFDVIVVDGSVLLQPGVENAFLTNLYFLLNTNGTIVIPDSKCAEVTKNFEGPVQAEIECGEDATAIKKFQSTDADVVFHIQSLLRSGAKEENSEDTAKIPVLGYIIQCGEMNQFKKNVRKFAAPVGRLVLLLRCDTDKDVTFLEFLETKIASPSFQYFVRPSYTLPVAYNFVLKSAFERDFDSMYVVFASPKVSGNTEALTEFARTCNKKITEDSFGIFLMCGEASALNGVYAHSRLAVDLAGYYPNDNVSLYDQQLQRQGLGTGKFELATSLMGAQQYCSNTTAEL